MGQYASFDPRVEIIGQNILSFLQNSQIENIQPILERRGLTDVKPDQWYPLQTWMEVLTEISEQSSAMFDFVSIGMAISETAVIPPEVAKLPFEQFMMMINDVYQMQHRGGDAGTIKVEQPGDKHLLLTLRVPYPDDLEYGVAYGFARRFLPAGTQFTVMYDENVPRREKGGQETLIHITWD